MMDRPRLNATISVDNFRDFYWLKVELLAFCRQAKLPSSGSKKELADRIEHFLHTGKVSPAKSRSSGKSRGAMPMAFTRQTVIGSNWRCSQGLRAFFEAELGSTFHFDKVMRDFIKYEEGKTLQDAINVWQEAKDNPRKKTEIAPQFEYMRHMRKYFEEHPDSTREEALKLWHEKKAQRKSTRA